MKTQWIQNFTLVALLSLNGSLALAGGDSSGGTDLLPPDANAAWFLEGADGEQARVIHYCVEIAPDFGVSPDEASATIEKAFGIWRDYIDLHQLNADPYRGRHLVLTVEKMASCSGNQDLRFLLGVETPEIQKARVRYFNPFAIAWKDFYDLQTGWGKGSIWVVSQGRGKPAVQVPNWQKPNYLLGQLLHEIGHVLGCEHIPGTIMRESLATILETGDSAWQLNRIDGHVLLAICGDNQTCYLEYPGLVRPMYFKMVAHREAVGVIQAFIKIKVANRKPAFELILKDSVGELVLVFELTPAFSSFFDFSYPAAVFKTVRNEDTEDGQWVPAPFSRNLFAGILTGELRVPGGKSYPATLTINARGGSIDLYFDSDSGKVPLFMGSIPLSGPR